MSELVRVLDRAIKVWTKDVLVPEMTSDGFLKIWEAGDEAFTGPLMEMAMGDGGLIRAELLMMQR